MNANPNLLQSTLEARSPDRRPIYAYITAFGHSASTLVSLILNTHPRILSVGEMHAPVHPRRDPAKRMCSCRKPMVDCSFYTELGRRLESQGFHFPLAAWDMRYEFAARPRLSRLMFRSLRNGTAEAVRDAICAGIPFYRNRRDYLDRMHLAFVREALDIADADVLVDAYKDPVRLRYLSQLPGIDLKVLFLVRDPRGWTWSTIKRHEKPDVRAIAKQWVIRQRNIERQMQRLDGTAFTLRYEELCRNPGAVLAQVGEYLGVGPIATPENFLAGEHHVLGNRIRLGASGVSDGSGSIRYDERWRANLTPEQVETVVDVTGPTARRLGYDL